MTNNPILAVEKNGVLVEVVEQENQFLNERDIPVEERLEKRAETLAEKLLNDAEEVLASPDEMRVDKQGNEYADTTSRRKYVLAVMAHVSKMVQGKQTVKLKKGEEARNNASFLMDLLKKAQSGRMDMAALQNLSPQKPNEQIIESV